ncbi:MAG: YdeI/OmpD-associated family protein [Lewinellaceae bacterium]|nr:YdeI/OmpD-associated family protein [Lewinellaceae bacterium]
MRDPRVDAYIIKAAPFAQPLLSHLREIVHQAIPDIDETIKWGFPHFMYQGAILCNMAAFKQHCTFGFWRAAELADEEQMLQTVGRTAMGHLGRLTQMEDLPPATVLTAYLIEAQALAQLPAPPARKQRDPLPELEIPPVLANALANDEDAKAAFERFSPSHRREYIEWIMEAKTSATQEKRVATTLEWLREGKSRNWKYQ